MSLADHPRYVFPVHVPIASLLRQAHCGPSGIVREV